MGDEPTDEILDATYRALCTHGYADLTIQNIAAETEKSKATIHYYYDTKEELFASFLDYLYEQYTAQIDSAGGETPREHLRSLLNVVLLSEDDTTGREFQTALLEVKAQAPYNGQIQERLVEFDEFLFERLREIIAAGADAGGFSTVIDPPVAAEFLTSAIKGAHTRQVAADRSPEPLHESMRVYVESCLRSDKMMGEVN